MTTSGCFFRSRCSDMRRYRKIDNHGTGRSAINAPLFLCVEKTVYPGWGMIVTGSSIQLTAGVSLSRRQPLQRWAGENLMRVHTFDGTRDRAFYLRNVADIVPDAVVWFRYMVLVLRALGFQPPNTRTQRTTQYCGSVPT